MTFRSSSLLLFLALLSVLPTAAQKIKTGSDKTIDFSQYQTYSILPPSRPPSRPYLYSVIVGTIDQEMRKRGLTKVEEGGDLYIALSGAIGVGLGFAAGAPILPSYSSMATYNYDMWVGSMAAVNTTRAVAQGSLVMQFVDSKLNHVVWSGLVEEKMDFEQKKDALERAEKAVRKLLKDFPPKKK